MRGDGFLTLAGMAAKNLARHRVKTVITVIAVAVSAALYIFMDAWLLGMNLDSRRNIVNYETGAVKVQKEAYFQREEDLPMYESFSGWEPLAKALETAGFRAAPRFVFAGTMYSLSGSAPVVINAVDPGRDEAMLRYPEYVESGRMIRGGRQEILLGTLAAEKLRVGIPGRCQSAEFEELLSLAPSGEDAAFIRSLYVPWGGAPKSGGAFAPKVDQAILEDRLVLRPDVTEAERDRFWKLLADSGRNDVRIATTIDTAELPESIDASRFEGDLLSQAGEEGAAALAAAYEKDGEGEIYRLREGVASPGGGLSGESGSAGSRALRVLLDLGYPQAVRHVNQLIDAVVVGVLNAPNPALNGNVAWIPLDSLQDDSGLALSGAVTEILVRSAAARDEGLPGAAESPQAVRSALERGLAGMNLSLDPELSVRSWKDYVPDYFAAAAGDQVSSRLMIFFLFVLSFIGIANTMLMAILERTKEIGMLRALGMTDRQLLLTYVTEATLIGLIGSALGAALGCLLNVPMVLVGVDYSAMTEAMNGDIGYRVATYFRSAWNFPTVAYTFAGASIISGLMAVPPTLRALSMPVTESLRFE